MKRAHFVPAAAVLAAVSLFSDTLSAQPRSRRPGTITCDPTIDPVPRRPLSLTSKVGTIRYTCTNDGRVQPGQPTEFRTHVMVDLMIELNANITNRIDFGAGEDVTDAVLRFGPDEGQPRVRSELGSSTDARFPRPQYGQLVALNGQLTETGKALGVEPKNHPHDFTMLLFQDIWFPVPYAPNMTYPGCMSHRSDDPNGCLPAEIELEIENLQGDGSSFSDLAQSYVITTHTSLGLFSVGFPAVQLTSACTDADVSILADPPSISEDGATATGIIQLVNSAAPEFPPVCLNTSGPNPVETRIWAFLSPNPQLQYDIFSDGTSPVDLRPVFGPNPDGTGGTTQAPLSPEIRVAQATGENRFLFKIPQGARAENLVLRYEIRGPSLESMRGTTVTIQPAPTSTIDTASADAPVPRFRSIEDLNIPSNRLPQVLGGCPTLNLLSGEPACGAEIRSVTDIGFVEGELARNGFFSVFVAGGPSETFAAQSLPLGQGAPVRIKISQGAQSVDAIDVFWNGSQYNGIVPKDAPLGDVEITLLAADQETPPFRTTIVERKPRFFTLDGFSAGMGVFQTFDQQRVPAVPIFSDGFESGDIAAWGSGIGPSANRSDSAPSPVENFAESAMVEAYVGGVPAERIFYAGPNPDFPALDQWNVLPSGLTPPGCAVPFDATFDGLSSNSVSIPVSPNGGPCEDPLNPYLEGGGAWPRETFDVQLLQSRVTVPMEDGSRPQARVESARVEAGQYNFTNSNIGVHYPSLGTCVAFTGAGSEQDDVLRRPPPVALPTGELRLVHGGETVMLDAGDPGVASWSVQTTPGATPFYVEGDSYTLRHSGSESVPAFDFRFDIEPRFGGATSAAAAPAQSLPRGWTNQDSFGRATAIGQDLTFEWETSGVNPAEMAITIAGVSAGDGQVGGFLCTADPTAGVFTVPARLTRNIPPTREPGRSVPLGALAVGSVGTKAGRVEIERLEQAGSRAYIDFQQRDVLPTVFGP